MAIFSADAEGSKGDVTIHLFRQRMAVHIVLASRDVAATLAAPMQTPNSGQALDHVNIRRTTLRTNVKATK